MTDITIAFDDLRPTRRSAAATQCGYSIIEDDGSVTTGQGKTYHFIATRIYDKRAPQGQRVEWDVELHHVGNGRRLSANALPAAKAEVLKLFKARIEQDNAAKDQVSEDAWALLTKAEAAQATEEANALDEVYLTDRQGLQQAGELGEELKDLWIESTTNGDTSIVPLTSQRLHIVWANNTQRHPSPRAVLKALKAGELVETQHSEYLLVSSPTPDPLKDSDEVADIHRRNALLASYATSRNAISAAPAAKAERELPLSRDRALEVLNKGSQAGSYRHHLEHSEELAIQRYWVDHRTPGAWSFGDVIRHCAKQPPAGPFSAPPSDEYQEAACRGLEVLRERAEPEDRLNTTPVIAELTWEDCKVISQRNGNLSPHAVLKGLKDGSVIYTSLSRYVLVSTLQHPSENAQAAIDLALATRAAQEAEERRKDALAVYRSLNRPIAAEEAPEPSPVRSCA